MTVAGIRNNIIDAFEKAAIPVTSNEERERLPVINS